MKHHEELSPERLAMTRLSRIAGRISFALGVAVIGVQVGRALGVWP